MAARGRWAAAIAAFVSTVLLVGVSSALAVTVPVWSAASELTQPVNAPSSAPAGNSGVSCVSAGNCVAVGWYYPASGVSEPMAATETDAGWGQASELTVPANAVATSGQWAAMAGVSCPSSGNCVAVGGYEDSNGFGQAMVASQTDGTWGQASEVSLPPDANTTTYGAGLYAVSCTSPGSCIAVGDYQNSSNEFEPMVVTETDGIWGQATGLTLPADAATAQQAAGLRGVSCASAGNCTAVGDYTDSSSEVEPMVVAESDGSWGNAAPIAPPLNGETGALYAVDCTGAEDCAAAGYDGPPNHASGLMVATETVGVWGQASQLALPSNLNAASQVGDYGGISCTSAGNCVMVGQYEDSSGRQEPLVATESGGIWGPASEMTLPSNATTSSSQFAGMFGVSCTSAGQCTAGGLYEDTGGSPDQAMVASSLASLSISTPSLPTATVGSKYAAQLSASGGTGSYGWSVVSGSLPTGLRLNPDGSITGTPTTPGIQSFTVAVSDAGPPAQRTRKALSITVDPGPVKKATALFGDQELTVTTPAQCVAPTSNMPVTFASTKHPLGEKLRFARVAVYLDRGVRHKITRRIDGRRRSVIVFRPDATSRHQPVHFEVSVANLTQGDHTLKLAARYVKAIRSRHHRLDLTVVKRLHEAFRVC